MNKNNKKARMIEFFLEKLGLINKKIDSCSEKESGITVISGSQCFDIINTEKIEENK